ncbi:MAG: hypothetical protein FD146_2827 [Anaerolineaceae bacterium]|nr:MAG: hypothetical protein FD146_2827 [Anaerolineaceae bacterium]
MRLTGQPEVHPKTKIKRGPAAAASHLTLRVTAEFALPVEADLIAEAHKLCESLGKNHDRI